MPNATASACDWVFGPELKARLDVTHKTLTKWIRNGVIPRPVYFSKRRIGWRRSSLEALFARLEKKAARTA
jgi:predicted DNA-binding transcriptional regulator AlpA